MSKYTHIQRDSGSGVTDSVLARHVRPQMFAAFSANDVALGAVERDDPISEGFFH